MGAIEHLNIRLPAAMAARLRGRVAAGDYADESEAIEDAIAQAEELGFGDEDHGPDLSETELARLRRDVGAAAAELDRDPSRAIPLADVRARFEAERVARGA